MHFVYTMIAGQVSRNTIIGSFLVHGISKLGHIERMQDTAIPKRCCTESCMQQDEEEDQE